jgi:hypothetical protein
VNCSSNSTGFECGSCPAGYNGNGVECWKILVEGKEFKTFRFFENSFSKSSKMR